MNILFLAIPLAMVLGTGLFFGFIWSVKSGQMDDLETPAHRMLIDYEKLKFEPQNIKETE